jgi:hypothetical protein
LKETAGPILSRNPNAHGKVCRGLLRGIVHRALYLVSF